MDIGDIFNFRNFRERKPSIDFSFVIYCSDSKDCCKATVNTIKTEIEDVLRFVRFERGNVIADWRGIEGIAPRENTYSEQLYNRILLFLTDSDVLSVDPNGNYGLYSGGLCLNPRYHISHLYFTRESDAVEYKSVKYGKAHYPVSIRKLEVIE